MTFVLEVKAVAIAQAAEAYAYYEEKSPGLGERFLTDLEAGYATLRATPFFQVRKTPFRYLHLRIFPYRIVYEVIADRVIIYQIRHTSRKPSERFGP